MFANNIKVLITAEHASLQFGGEAALPLHYFRVLRSRSIETWLVVHERTRDELKLLFPEEIDRIYFVPDTMWHLIVWQCSKLLPSRVSYFTFGLILRLMTQVVQHRLIKEIVREQKINVIHQPIPVSPKEPSMIFGLGAPVVIGPMNGGMDYPPTFKKMQSRFVGFSLRLGRLFANLFNTLIPGKRQATTLLVANQRTREALPKGIHGKVIELVENGVDFSVWRCQHKSQSLEKNSGKGTVTQYSKPEFPQPTKFIFVGRLVDWKAVDLLIAAFKQVSKQIPAELEIIGDGPLRAVLEAQAKELGFSQPHNQQTAQDSTSQLKEGATVYFTGWLSQAECAQRLQQADVFVLPSLLECGGAVVLEAMAMGLPVIASNWGGPADYLDESCGILVNPESRESLINGIATAMLKTAQNPELRRAMGRAGYQRVLDHFDWEVKVDIMLGIYQEAMTRQSTSAESKQF
ncbi:glycosyltransferase [Lyngbya aestuarii]|uniref:glycosyltransferase n=1 Tax=Lyngbya aestuarii TaxID=118322 RepID=UPI00403E0A86